MQEVYGDVGALGRFARHAGQTAALAADGDVERQIPLLAQLRNGHVLTDLDAAADLHAQLAQDLDLGVDDGLFQLERRDAVGHHAAGTGGLFKDRGLVAAGGQIVRGGQARGACADDGDLLVPAGQSAGGDDDGRDIARLGVQILLGEEFLDRVDGDGLIDRAAGARFLAALVADPAADGGEGVVLLDEGQCLLILALRGELQIALHRDVRWASRFARRGAGIVAVDAVPVAVVDAPLFRPPLDIVG